MSDLFISILLNVPWVYLLVEFLHYNKKEKQSLKRPIIETVLSLAIYVFVYIFTDYKTDVIVDVVFVGLLFIGFVVIKMVRKQKTH